MKKISSMMGGMGDNWSLIKGDGNKQNYLERSENTIYKKRSSRDVYTYPVGKPMCKNKKY